MPKETTHGDLGAKLGDLGARMSQMTDSLSPAIWWKNPWVKMGAGFAVGYALGSIGRRGGAKAMNHESILHAIVRSGLAAAAALLVRSALDAEKA